MTTLRVWPDIATWIAVRVMIVGMVLIAAGLWYTAISIVF